VQTNFVLTVTGPDKIGIVERVTKIIFDCGGNVETSRMARLGGEFAILMLVSMPEARVPALNAALTILTDDGYKVTTTATVAAGAVARADWLAYEIEVEGADDEGIIHEIALCLSRSGISIEAVDSETTPAPVSGSPLFAMTAHVIAPPASVGSGWEAALEQIADRMNLEIRVGRS
jgi:glycine cleavage system transcriptional repressor